MKNIDKVIEAFVTGDYFILFLVLTLAVLLVLVLALIKSRGEFNELLTYERNKEEPEEDKDDILEEMHPDDTDLLSDLKTLMSDSKDDVIDENKPLIKQVDISGIKTFDDIVDEYENVEEENAVISADELEYRAKQRMEELGTNDNQVAIAKYEEEQEKKAIISYEQLLKNASNITLSYKEEDTKAGAPKVNKVEVEQKEVSPSENYIAEEEFLKILKEFRISME